MTKLFYHDSLLFLLNIVWLAIKSEQTPKNYDDFVIALALLFLEKVFSINLTLTIDKLKLFIYAFVVLIVFSLRLGVENNYHRYKIENSSITLTINQHSAIHKNNKKDKLYCVMKKELIQIVNDTQILSENENQETMSFISNNTINFPIDNNQFNNDALIEIQTGDFPKTTASNIIAEIHTNVSTFKKLYINFPMIIILFGISYGIISLGDLFISTEIEARNINEILTWALYSLTLIAQAVSHIRICYENNDLSPRKKKMEISVFLLLIISTIISFIFECVKIGKMSGNNLPISLFSIVANLLMNFSFLFVILRIIYRISKKVEKI